MTRLIGVGLIAVALLAFPACGGGDDDEDTGRDTAAPAASATAAEAPSGTPSATSSSGGGGGDLNFFASGECRKTALAMSQAMSSVLSPTGLSASDDPFGELAAALDAAEEAAPDDIKSDLGMLAAAYADLAAAIEDAGGWNPASGQIPPAAVMEAFQSFDTPALEAAGNNVSGWFEENCE